MHMRRQARSRRTTSHSIQVRIFQRAIEVRPHGLVPEQLPRHVGGVLTLSQSLARKLLVCPIGQHDLAVLDKEPRFHDLAGVGCRGQRT